MSSGSTSSTLTVVSLGTTFFHGSLISHELVETLSRQASTEKSLLLYNRRGSGRAWICEDCGYFPLCPHCDIAMAYHTFPTLQLVCHHCSYRTRLIGHCPSCQGISFHEVGIGIQRVASDIISAFPEKRVLRIDSDTEMKKDEIIHATRYHDIILGTYTSLSLIHLTEVTTIVFLLFESELTLPDYRMEEDLYHAIDYAKKSGKHIMIQTYIPDHPLLTTITEGNYRDFLTLMSDERKKFDYPPYTDFVIIRIHDESKEKLRDIVSKLMNKIETLKTPDISLSHDPEGIERTRGEWVECITLKGKNIKSFLDHLEVELVRNRSITLEWH